MARAITYAIRVTYADGRSVFLREGHVTGVGRIETFYSRDQAEAAAAGIRQGADAGTTITVIERSHGRRE